MKKEVSHVTENERMRKHLKNTNDSWRMDETYIKIKGKDCYLYRAVDSTGKTIDFYVSEQRDKEAANYKTFAPEPKRLLLFYAVSYFIPLIFIPSTRYFWSIKNINIVGMTVNTPDAITASHGVSFLPIKVAIAT